MHIPLAPREVRWLAAWALLALVALVGPPLAQPQDFHHFADQVSLGGLPNALDVLSNLPFAFAGLMGGWLLWRSPADAMSRQQRAMAGLFFAGLVLTAFASAWYHLAPDDAGLAIDRLGMSVAFAGILGLLAASQVSERAAVATGLGLLLAGPAAVALWLANGNLLPWAVLQAGGLLLILGFGLLRPRLGTLRLAWWPVVVVYGLAKACEGADHAIFELTGQWLSGHSLKHIVAAFAAVPLLAALAVTARRQNADESRAAAPLPRRVPNA